MRVAVVAPRDPVPVYTGLLERLYQLCRFLGERHDVAVYFPDEPSEADADGRVPDHRPFERRGLDSRTLSALDRVVPHYSPLRGLYNLHPWLYPQLRRALSAYAPDAVVVELPYLAPVATAAARPVGCPVVVSEHNVEFALAARLDIPLAGALARFERRVLRAADAAVAVSETDARTLRDVAGGTPVHVAPNGVDVGRFAPDRADGTVRDRYGLGDGPVVVYHGTLGNAQNAEAVEALVATVFPAVRERHPSASLLLVGADPPAVDRPGVVATGLVDDLPGHVAAADVAAVPLQSGSGTKLKVLEYLAAGVPVATTPVGAEGLPLADGETALVADGAAGVARATARLCADPDLRERLSGNGRRLATGQFAWDETLATYEDVLAAVA